MNHRIIYGVSNQCQRHLVKLDTNKTGSSTKPTVPFVYDLFSFRRKKTDKIFMVRKTISDVFQYTSNIYKLQENIIFFKKKNIQVFQIVIESTMS